MIRKIIELSDDDWEVLKKYARATRKYQEMKGYTVNDALEEMIRQGMTSVALTEFSNSDDEEVDWL